MCVTVHCTVTITWLCTVTVTVICRLYSALYCTALFCSVYCTVQCSVVYCTVQFTVLYSVLYCTVYCTVLYCTVYCTVLHRTALYCTEYSAEVRMPPTGGPQGYQAPWRAHSSVFWRAVGVHCTLYSRLLQNCSKNSQQTSTACFCVCFDVLIPKQFFNHV